MVVGFLFNKKNWEHTEPKGVYRAVGHEIVGHHLDHEVSVLSVTLRGKRQSKIASSLFLLNEDSSHHNIVHL